MKEFAEFLLDLYLDYSCWRFLVAIGAAWALTSFLSARIPDSHFSHLLIGAIWIAGVVLGFKWHRRCG